jgi:hypothetical protein
VATGSSPAAQQLALAQKYAQASQSAALKLIRDQQARADAANLAKGQSIQGFATAAANLAKGDAAAAQAPFETAAHSQAGFGKGYSDTAQTAINQDAQAANDFLAKLGSPQSVTAPQGADAIYHMGGAVPARALSTAGAAFGAQAALQPGNLLARGQQDYTSNLFAGRTADQGFSDQVATLAAQNPKLVQDFLAHIQSAARQDQQLAQSQRDSDRQYALSVAKFNEDVRQFGAADALKRLKAQQPNYHYFQGANGGEYAVDPATGAVTQLTGGASKQSASSLRQTQAAKNFVRQSAKGYYAYTAEDTKPLGTSDLAALAKAAKMSYSAFVSDQNALTNAGVGYYQHDKHEDPAIQQIYLSLIKDYGVPARQAFNIVGSTYKQWASKRRATYFPNPGKAGAAAEPAAYTGGRLNSGQQTALAVRALQMVGPGLATPENVQALVGRINQESGGNPVAINLWDSNAKAGHPSKGILQTIDSTFNKYAAPGHANVWDPLDNTLAALRYMLARYGRIVGPSAGGY